LRPSALDQLNLVNQPPDLERVTNKAFFAPMIACLGACVFGVFLPLGTISFALLVAVVSWLGYRAYFAALPIVGASRGYSVEVRPVTGDLDWSSRFAHVSWQRADNYRGSCAL
jgi:hypothetical protein